MDGTGVLFGIEDSVSEATSSTILFMFPRRSGTWADTYVTGRIALCQSAFNRLVWLTPRQYATLDQARVNGSMVNARELLLLSSRHPGVEISISHAISDRLLTQMSTAY